MPSLPALRRFVIWLSAISCLSAGLAACGSDTDTAPHLSTEERLALPANAEYGQRIFLQCAQCHERSENAGHRVGPNLWSIVGEAAAHHPDFAYSKAMERSGLVWDAVTLDAYLANPQKVVPGTRMAFAGLDNEADRRDLIAYLETLE